MRRGRGSEGLDRAAIGQRIAHARLRRDLTQEELGHLLDLTSRSVASHEAGTHSPLPHLSRYAEMLDVSEEWLLHGDENFNLGDVNAKLDLLLHRSEEILELLRK